MRLLRTLVVSLALLTGVVACGDGEDRPGQVTSEGDTGSVSGSASGSASGTGSGSASGHGHVEVDEADFTDTEADTVVDVTFKDFAFVGLPQSVKGPKVFFRATNQGKEAHELVVMKGDEAHYELEAIAPGEDGTLAAELEPGEYRIVCHVETDGETHEELGMVANLTVE